MTKRLLILEDGTTFRGTAFGDQTSTYGEVVFNTGMTGYQEVISDPAYYGQIITLTYPLIGGYGINRDDFESITPFINGLVVKKAIHHPSNFRSEESLDQFLQAHGIPGISGVDTRMLTRVLRNKGTMRGAIVNAEQSIEEVVERLRTKEEETDQVKQTSISKPYIVPGRGLRIVLIDLGMKHSLLRELTERQCHITVVPYNYDADCILRFKPDGVLLSNGPGNPEHVQETVETLERLLDKIPVFSIGLGHQLFAKACGVKTKKLKVGHHGTSYPVKDLANDKTWITTQNRNYTVDESSIENTDLTITHRSLNDHSVEGLKHNVFPAFSVQFNPEGSPGSEETNSLFDTFLKLIKQYQVKQEVNIHAKK